MSVVTSRVILIWKGPTLVYALVLHRNNNYCWRTLFILIPIVVAGSPIPNHALDPIVKGDYVIAYFHTLTSNSNYPSFSWLKDVYNVLPYKYKKNLKAFYIMMTWWFTTFMAPAIKQKVHSLPGVEYLYTVLSPDQLEIPAFITEYDMTVSIPLKIAYTNIGYSWLVKSFSIRIGRISVQ
nr:unnamed protein product [Callosobruchus analis]